MKQGQNPLNMLTLKGTKPFSDCCFCTADKINKLPACVCFSPRMRVSYIVFSARAVVILPLTGDRYQLPFSKPFHFVFFSASLHHQSYYVLLLFLLTDTKNINKDNLITQKLSSYQSLFEHLYPWCVLRSEINEGLEKLSQIKPAGETYMHEGIKAVGMLI